MRTKTLALSALLGMMGSASLVAQTNVYSLNAVGYVNVTIAPGFNIITCPLITSPDNTLGSVIPNSNGLFTGSSAYFFQPSTGGYASDNALNVGTGRGKTANPDGYAGDGTNLCAPGVGFFFDSTLATNVTVTFVGTVPQGSLTNTLFPGYNLVGSAVPTSGDIITNSISMLTNYNVGDTFYMFDPASQSYSAGIGGTYNVVPSTGRHSGSGYDNNFSPSDPVTYYDYQGFFYYNSTSTSINWVENFSVNP